MLANFSNNLQKNNFFLVHFNVRSLSKNKDKIEECLYDMTSGVKSILKLYLSKSIVTDGKTTRSKVTSID